jgi:hypothetical protein
MRSPQTTRALREKPRNARWNRVESGGPRGGIDLRGCKWSPHRQGANGETDLGYQHPYTIEQEDVQVSMQAVFAREA